MTIDVLITQGWDVASVKPVAAAEKFRQALDLQPAHIEASYGLGYALLQQGDNAGALPHLCQALQGNQIETERDVSALLTNNNLTCR